MKIDLSELERKLSCGMNLTIKESTTLIESIEDFIDEKIELQEQLNTLEMALTQISEIIDYDIHECNYGCDNDCELDGSLNMYSIENVQSIIDSALAEIGGNDE